MCNSEIWLTSVYTCKIDETIDQAVKATSLQPYSESVHLFMKFQGNSRKSLFAKQFAKSEEKDFGISTRPQPAIRCEDGDIDEDMIEDDGNCKTLIFIL